MKASDGTSGADFTKQQIFEHVCKDTYTQDDNTMMVHISNLRNGARAGDSKKIVDNMERELEYQYRECKNCFIVRI